jgi:hypothetical protein
VCDVVVPPHGPGWGTTPPCPGGGPGPPCTPAVASALQSGRGLQRARWRQFCWSVGMTHSSLIETWRGRVTM